MEAGYLPHLRRITEQGAWGELQSTRPPTTAPAWVACITGTNPGQHGVFDFRESPLLDPSRSLISSRSVRVPTLWQIPGHHGRHHCRAADRWRRGFVSGGEGGEIVTY